MFNNYTQFVFITFLMLGLLLAGSGFAKAKPEVKEEKIIKVPVEVTSVKRGDVAATLFSTGTVEANLNATLTAEVSGEVKKVLVAEGQRVKKDEPLLQLDDYVLKLQRDRAAANLTGMTSGYEYISRVAVLQVETRLKQAEAGFAAAQAQYEYALSVAQLALDAKLAGAKAARDMAASRLELAKTGGRPEERLQVKAALDAAQANYENTQKNYERLAKLFAQGAISSQQYDDATARKEGVAAQLKTAEEAWNMVVLGARKEDKEAAAANLSQAEAMLLVVEKEVATKAWEKDVTLAKTALDQAEANVILMRKELKERAYEADIRQAEARFKDAEANLKIMERQVENTTIAAPFSGVTYGRAVDLGEMVNPGQPVLKVMQIDKIKVAFTVGETNLPLVKMGQTVNVMVDAYPDKVFYGEIVEVSPALDLNTRTLAIKARLDNPEYLLKPGMFARIAIETARHAQTLVIPKDALVFKGDAKLVYTVDNGKAVQKSVELGLEAQDNWEVKAGLNEGDVIVVLGQSNLENGKEVTINKQR